MLAILSTLALALAADTKKVVVESSNSDLSGKGISNIHFGAGLNGVLISDSPIEYSYNSTDNYIYQDVQGSEFQIYFGELFDQLVGEFTTGINDYGALKDATVVENDYLTLNGSSSVFYACDKLSWDPYSYTGDGTKGVAVYAEGEEVPSGCESIKLHVE